MFASHISPAAKYNPPPQFANWGTSFQKEACAPRSGYKTGPVELPPGRFHYVGPACGRPQGPTGTKKRANNVRPYIFQKSLVFFDNLCYSKYMRQIKAGRGVSSPPRPCAGARPPTQQHCCTGTHYTRHPCLFQAQILVYEFLVVSYVMRGRLFRITLFVSTGPCGGSLLTRMINTFLTSPRRQCR